MPQLCGFILFLSMGTPESPPLASSLHSDLYGHYATLRQKGDLCEPSLLSKISTEEPVPFLDELWRQDPSHTAFARRLGEIAQAHPLLPLVSAQVEEVSALKMLNYPPSLQKGAGVAAVKRVLGKERAAEFSFMALGENTDGEVEYAACALARQEASSVPPLCDKPVLHFGDLVVSREYRNSPLGARMYREMLTKAVMAGLTSVETDARGATASRFLKSGRLLERWGFKIAAEGQPVTFDDEVIYPLRLTIS